MNEIWVKKLTIDHFSDINTAKQEAKTIAASIGFDEVASNEISLVVDELASNIIYHAKSGILRIYALPENSGIRIESLDRGPGIADVEQAITDGFSTVDSLGYGLGTVNRLMDSLQINSQNFFGGLTQIICERRLRKKGGGAVETPSPFDIGAATRPYPGLKINGDEFVIKKWGNMALVAVIDGLGHGQFAHRAAQKARQYIEPHFDQPLENIFLGVTRSCRATRGVVMALAKFDSAEETLTFANVGNVEPRVIGAAEPVKFIIRRGIVGASAPKPVITKHPWRLSNIMILHTDGVASHWSSKDFSHLWNKPANTIVNELLKALAKDHDDATVVVVKGGKFINQ